MYYKEMLDSERKENEKRGKKKTYRNECLPRGIDQRK